MFHIQDIGDNDMFNVTFQESLAHFFRRYAFKISNFYDTKVNKYQPNVWKKVVFDHFTKPLDSLTRSQNASFGQDKRTKNIPVSNTQSSFQSECVKSNRVAYSTNWYVSHVYWGYTTLLYNIQEVCTMSIKNMSKYLPHCVIPKRLTRQSGLFRFYHFAAQ